MKPKKFSSTKEGKKLIDECPCSADEDCNCYDEIANRAYELGRKQESEELIKRWGIPEDEFGYIGKCTMCNRPCLEIEQESNGLCFYCNYTYEKTKKGTTKKIFERLEKIEVKCSGMSKDFVSGSDWCNNLWKEKIKAILKEIS